MTTKKIGEKIACKKPTRIEVELWAGELVGALEKAGYDVSGYDVCKAFFKEDKVTDLGILTVLLELKDEVGE
jgi:hypothetical protein